MLRITVFAAIWAAAAAAQTPGPAPMPLVQTRTDLELARSRVLEGDFQQAAPPLRAAAKSLADFENQYPGPEAIRADYLRGQMVYRAARLQWDADDAVDWINYWLDTIAGWQRKEGVHTDLTREPWQQVDKTY